MTLFFIVDSFGNFEPAKAESYFDNFLFALETIDKPTLEYIEKLLQMGKNILIDSGVYAVVSAYSKKKGVPINRAFTMTPDKIDGFNDLYESYLRIITALKDRVWGYIEIDLGKTEDKIQTREKLERAGLKPMPVYHPLTDPPEYFDYLCEHYDRICVGQLAQTASDIRLKMICHIEMRRKKYPHLWIHYLGITISQYCYQFKIDSCDSSAWSQCVRWGKIDIRSLLKPVDCIEKRIFDFNDKDSRLKALKLSGLNFAFNKYDIENYLKETNADI